MLFYVMCTDGAAESHVSIGISFIVEFEDPASYNLLDIQASARLIAIALSEIARPRGFWLARTKKRIVKI